MKSVFLKMTSRSGCGLAGWSFCSRQKHTPFLLAISVLCVGNPFCTLRYASRTIIDEVTVPLSEGVVGLLVE
jgi:hypothetical protein